MAHGVVLAGMVVWVMGLDGGRDCCRSRYLVLAVSSIGVRGTWQCLIIVGLGDRVHNVQTLRQSDLAAGKADGAWTARSGRGGGAGRAWSAVAGMRVRDHACEGIDRSTRGDARPQCARWLSKEAKRGSRVAAVHGEQWQR